MTAAQPVRDPLLPHHRAHLEGSAISPAVIAARGYRSVTAKAEAKRLGFADSQLHVPAIYVPIHGVTGEVVSGLLRPDEPRVKDDKKIKYEIPKGSRMRLDVPPGARARLGSPDFPLFVVEGAKKADAAVTRGLCCVSLTGVWNWRGTNFEGGKTALPDLELVHLKDRVVYIVFDSDATEKKPVNMAMERLGGLLKLWGSKVRYVYLPSGPGGVKVGLDDYFAAGRTVDDLLGLASTELERVPFAEPPPPYTPSETGMTWHYERDGHMHEVLLCNFTAVIRAEITRTDGAETTRELEIEGRCRGREYRVVVPAKRLTVQNWHIEEVGCDAIVHTARGAERHVLAAMQFLSLGTTEHRLVYEHTGWIEHQGAWVYLSGNGAIGENGAVTGVEVALPSPLAPFKLCPPPTSDDLVAAVRASLRILDVGPGRITLPLLAATYRSAIQESSQSLVLEGRTGTFKSQLAALAQQHFGAGFDAEHLPAAWSGTANSIEVLAFHTKDAVLVVDDYAPTGTQQDMARQGQQADRVGRAMGNRAGRSRLRRDSTLQAGRPPRGLMLWTAETLPPGHSLRARGTNLEVREGDIDVEKLTLAQRDAKEGRLAGSMAGFLRWLAHRRTQLLSNWSAQVAESRSRISRAGAHRRLPTNAAELLCGALTFFDFARDVGAVTTAQHEHLVERAERTIIETLSHQVDSVGDADPVEQLRGTLSSGIASGRAHVASLAGEAPSGLEAAWGWRPSTSRRGGDDLPDERWAPQGLRIGWVSDDELCLDLGAALRVAQEFAQASAQPLALDIGGVRRRLRDGKHLLRTEGDRFDVKVTVEGRRQRVVVVSKSFLFPMSGEDDRHTEAAPAEQRVNATSQSPDKAETPVAGLADSARDRSWRGWSPPQGACFSCKRTDFRTCRDGQEICNHCSPAPDGGAR